MAEYTKNQKTKYYNVLEYLFDRRGEWVPGEELETPEVGGGAGCMRFREARKNGWPVECKPNPKGGYWLYRMKPE